MDEIIASWIKILVENKVSDCGEDTVGEDSEDEDKPASPGFKAGAKVVSLGQEGDEMC
jgi:hypothetical protein